MESDPVEPAAVGAVADQPAKSGIDLRPRRLLDAGGEHQRRQVRLWGRRGGLRRRKIALVAEDPRQVQAQVGGPAFLGRQLAEVAAGAADLGVFERDGQHRDDADPVLAPAPDRGLVVVALGLRHEFRGGRRHPGGVFRRGAGRVCQHGVPDQRREAGTDLDGGAKLLAHHFRVHRGVRFRAAQAAGSPRRANGAVFSGALSLGRRFVGLAVLGPRRGPLQRIASRRSRVLLSYRRLIVLMGLF